MDKEEILRSINSSLDTALAGAGELYKASHYAAFPAGKRLRPLIALTLANDLGVDPEPFSLAACALELLHTSSLIHDDLPCMDNDDFRRGRPTVHRAFSESTALLTGDFLVAKAFDVIFDCVDLNPQQQATLCRSLSVAYRSLCEGQELDLQTEKDIEKITKIHSLKTGALYQACFEFGGVFGGVSGKHIEDLAQTGMLFGILFQILDDYLDIYGDPAARGRPKGSDEKNQKETFFTLHKGDDAIEKMHLLMAQFNVHVQSVEKSLNRVLDATKAVILPVLNNLK